MDQPQIDEHLAAIERDGYTIVADAIEPGLTVGDHLESDVSTSKSSL